MFVRSIGTQTEHSTALEDIAGMNTTNIGSQTDAPRTYNSTGTETDINGVSVSKVLQALFSRALSVSRVLKACRDVSVKVRSVSQTKGGNGSFLDICEVHQLKMKPDQLEKSRNGEMMSSLKKEDFQEQCPMSHSATANVHKDNSRENMYKGLVDGQQVHIKNEISEKVSQISGGRNYYEPVSNDINELEVNNEFIDGNHDTDDVEILPCASGMTSGGESGKEKSTNNLCLGEIAENVYDLILETSFPYKLHVNPAEEVGYEREECEKLNNGGNRQDMLSSVTDPENALGEVKDETRSSSGETNQTQEQSPSTGKGRFKCTKCEQTFKCRKYLVVHFQTHTRERPFQCTQCEKAYKTSSNLTFHLQIHTEERPYKCMQCDKAFKRKHHLLVHLRVHTGERPYKCTLCDKAFNRRVQLLIHFRIHTGEMPYKCTQCNKAFRSNNGLSAHLRSRSHRRKVVQVYPV